MKNRINDYMTFIEAVSEEIKKYTKEIKDIEQNIAKEPSEELKKKMASEHFAISQYAMILGQDMSKTINKLSECYTCSQLLQVDLSLSDEEAKILDKYALEAANIFVINKGEVISKQEGLLDIMLNKAQSMVNAPWVGDYIKQISN